MTWRHLGLEWTDWDSEPPRPHPDISWVQEGTCYCQFHRHSETMMRDYKLTCEITYLAPYLWFAGEYWSWWDNGTKAKIDGWLKKLFARFDKNLKDDPKDARRFELLTATMYPTL